MSKFPHDDFAKAYLTELLSTIGKAVPNHPLKAETRAADLWFELNPKSQAQRSQLGLLGRLLTRDSLIEVFRNPATPVEIRTCQGKLSNLECHLLRQAKRRRKTLTEETLPFLWLIMPTASDEIRQGFSVLATETSGVYEFPNLQRVGLVVVHQLPKTEDTLWLRILGRAGDQRRAVEEFAQRPVESSLHTSIEELLADYRAILEKQRKLTPEEEELVMNLSAAYLKKQEEWKQEGEQKKAVEVAINLLREGSAPDLIAKVTKLSLKEIEKLRESL
jgi:molybdopterin converting factor small subunit